MEDITIKIKSSKWDDCLQLNEYGGKISLCAAREGKDGTVWKDWAFPQDKDRKPRAKAIPVKVLLGNSKDEAIATLRALLAGLDGKITQSPQQPAQNDPYPDQSYADGNGPPPIDGDDIPF